MKLEHVDLDNLRPLDNNPRIISKEGTSNLRNSIELYGFFKPLIVWRDAKGEVVVIGGNQRLSVLLQAQDDGVSLVDGDRIPVVFFEGTEAQARACVLRDNAQEGEWDWDALPEYMQELEGLFSDDYEVNLKALTGFTEQIIDDLHELYESPDVGLDRYVGAGEEESPPTPEESKGEEVDPGSLRKSAKFVCGNIRGNIPVELYNRFLGAFNARSKGINSTQIPEILSKMLDEMESA